MRSAFLQRFLPILAVFAGTVGISAASFAQSAASPSLVNHWIRQAEDKSIEVKIGLPQGGGQVLAVEAATVALADVSGKARVEKTDASGSCTFTAVEPGVYTVLTRGANDVCAIVAVRVLAHEDKRASMLVSAVEVPAASVDFTSVNMNLIRYLPPTPSVADADLIGGGEELAASFTGAPMHRIRQTNGGLAGQIFSVRVEAERLLASREANVFLFEGGVEIARTLTDSSGRFEFPTLEPGLYSLMTVGSSGSGLVGFELVAESERSFARDRREQDSLVAKLQDETATQFVMQVAPGSGMVNNFQVISDEVIEERVIGEVVLDSTGAPMVGGGGSGGFGGGGAAGGGAGGGSIGGVLGLAGVAAAIAASSSSRRGDRIIIPPVATDPMP